MNGRDAAGPSPVELLSGASAPPGSRLRVTVMDFHVTAFTT